MVLEDKHIHYLKQVEENRVKLWWNPTKTLSRYVDSVWGDDAQIIDQTVAAQMHTLGATHVAAGGGMRTQPIELTDRGRKILLDEAEAWA